MEVDNMIYNKDLHHEVIEHHANFVNLANNIQWITDGCPYMKVEFDLLLALISEDYDRIEKEITPFMFRESHFMEDLSDMFAKVLEAEVDMVYDNLMQSIEIQCDDDTISIAQWVDDLGGEE